MSFICELNIWLGMVPDSWFTPKWLSQNGHHQSSRKDVKSSNIKGFNFLEFVLTSALYLSGCPTQDLPHRIPEALLWACCQPDQTSIASRGCLVMPGWSQWTCSSSTICRNGIQWIVFSFSRSDDEHTYRGDRIVIISSHIITWKSKSYYFRHKRQFWSPYKNIILVSCPNSFGSSPEKLQPTRILHRKQAKNYCIKLIKWSIEATVPTELLQVRLLTGFRDCSIFQ
jgi:hypothetical protein